MNLLAKDKYRTKILQHVLQQCDHNSSANDSDIERPFEDLQFIKNQCQNIYRNMLFDKVSKQKPLISDLEDIETDGQSRQFIQKAGQSKQTVNKKQIQVNQNHHKNTTNKSQPKQTINHTQQNKQMLKFINESRPQTHLHKQPYIYHQKLPVMSVSSQYDQELVKKLRTGAKISSTANKQNNQKESNHQVKVQKKEKKYRFIAPSKVAEVLKSKRQNVEKDTIIERGTIIEKEIQIQSQVPDAIELESDNFSKQQKNSVNKLNETHRSRGSREMIQFLQSARDKLFSSMKSPPLIQLQSQHQNQQQTKSIEEQIPHNIQKKEQHDQNQYHYQLNHYQQAQHQPSPAFKIEIQVSATKSCQLSLNLLSNPQQISKQFILQNQKQLSTFTYPQIQKLQQLLSRKIQNQINKQLLLFRKQKQNELNHKYRQVIQHNGVHQVLIGCLDSDRLACHEEKERKDSRNFSNLNKKTQNKTPLQFSHVYIQNIQPPFIKAQSQKINNKKLYHLKKKYPSNDQTPQLRKLVSFNPKSNPQTFNHSSQQQISLEGYLNSPHQLITYRPESSLTLSDNQQNLTIQDPHAEIEQKRQHEISHFPLSASISQHLIVKNLAQSSEIGASKILSKSRSKLINKLKKQQDFQQQPLSYPVQDSNFNHEKFPQSQQSMKQNYFSQKIHSNNFLTTTRPINSISSQIVSRVGKQNILNSIKQKQLSKRQMILKHKQAKQMQELQECSFMPKINNLSKSIDQNKKKKIKIGDLIENDSSNSRKLKNSSFFREKSSLNHHEPHTKEQMKQSNQFDSILTRLKKSRCQRSRSRHEELYENHKQIEARKQYVRQKSIQEISFKPQINRISKKIMETKRNSLNNSTCQQFYSLANSKTNMSRHQSTCKKPQQKRKSLHSGNHTYDQDSVTYNHHNKRKSMNMSRNLQGLQIGEYLYKEAMRMKKKKQSIPVKRQQNFKPLQKSQQMVNKVKQNRLSESFYELINIPEQTNVAEYEFVLKPQYVNLEDAKFTKTYLRHLVPLLSELKELDVSLTREEFIESGLKLISCLSQDQKAQFLGKRSICGQNLQEKDIQQQSMNKFSKDIVEKKQYYLQDIYHRGVMYKKSIKEKLQLDMESKVRKQLQKCTFKPKINTAFISNE